MTDDTPDSDPQRIVEDLAPAEIREPEYRWIARYWHADGGSDITGVYQSESDAKGACAQHDRPEHCAVTRHRVHPLGDSSPDRIWTRRR